MKAGDLVMWLFVGLFGFIVWTAFGPAGTPAAASSGASSASYQSAMASGLPVLLDFSATWCGPCQQVKPVVHELSAELAGKAKVVMIDVDEHPDLAQKYGVRGIPCFVAVRNGKETARQVGGIPKSEMKRLLGL